MNPSGVHRPSRSIDGKPFSATPQLSMSAAAAVAVGKLLGGGSGVGKGGGSGPPDSALDAALTSACGEDPSTAGSSAGEVVLHVDGAGGAGGMAVAVGAVATLVDPMDGGGSDQAVLGRTAAPLVSAGTSAGTHAGAGAGVHSSISAGAAARAPASVAAAAGGDGGAAVAAGAVAAQSSSDLLWGIRPKSDAIGACEYVHTCVPCRIACGGLTNHLLTLPVPASQRTKLLLPCQPRLPLLLPQ